MNPAVVPPIGADDVRFRALGDSAVLVEAPTLTGEAAWRWVHALDAALGAVSGIDETAPALVNLLVRFDPLVTDHVGIADAVRAVLPVDDVPATPEDHRLSVRYGGADGPDLGEVAIRTATTELDVVAAHTGAEFTVRMYGFAPGYAYLGGLPDGLRLARKPAAVRDVPAGSVIIANDQCLVTTITMPTGWWVIGRCDDPILLVGADRPARFAVGDRVRFTADATSPVGGGGG